MHDRKITIALNVSRARLQVIGFILTIDIFALGIFLSSTDRHFSLQILIELNVFFSIVASLSIGTVSAILMLLSERLDSEGKSDVTIFAIGEMTMYVAIVQTIGGIFMAFIVLFHVSLGEPTVTAVGVTTTTAELLQAGESFQAMVSWMIALLWAFIAYVAPAWSLYRMPDTRQRKFLYFGYYVILTSLVFALSAHALHIELLARGESIGVLRLFLQNFWAPGLWSGIVAAP